MSFFSKKIVQGLIFIIVILGVILFLLYYFLSLILGFTPIYEKVYYKFSDYLYLYREEINFSICSLEKYNFDGETTIFAGDYSGHELEKFLYDKIQNLPSYKHHSQEYPAHEQAITFQLNANEYLKANSQHYTFAKDLQPNSIIIRILSVPTGITIPESNIGKYNLYMDICNNKILWVTY